MTSNSTPNLYLFGQQLQERNLLLPCHFIEGQRIIKVRICLVIQVFYKNIRDITNVR